MRATTTLKPYAAPPAVLEALVRAAKNVALFVAAPFIALAYVVVGPFVGLGALAYIGVRAALKRA